MNEPTVSLKNLWDIKDVTFTLPNLLLYGLPVKIKYNEEIEKWEIIKD
jgi:hypothetical protein